MTIITKNKGTRTMEYSEERLLKSVDKVLNEFPQISDKAKDKFKRKIAKFVEKHESIRAKEITDQLILNALDKMSKNSEEDTLWTFVASRIYMNKLYKESAYNRSYDADDKYGSLIGLLKTFGEKGIYSEDILKHYSTDELKEAQSMINPQLDNLFTYIGLKTLHGRYLANDYEGRTFELPQERYMIIALTLMQLEPKDKRMELVKEAYWALSNHYMTVATPTWSNAGKSHGQLSSCFIDTVDDSLQGIYDSNTDIANLSKYGGGIGEL